MKFISSVAGKQRAAAQWFYPTHGAAIVAGVTWLTFSCPGCGQFGSVDLRTLDRHRCGSISSLIASVACHASTNFASLPNAKYYVALQHFVPYHALQSMRRSLPSIGNPALARAGAQGGRARFLLIARPTKEPL
jgi:hypothetical protein